MSSTFVSCALCTYVLMLLLFGLDHVVAPPPGEVPAFSSSVPSSPNESTPLSQRLSLAETPRPPVHAVLATRIFSTELYEGFVTGSSDPTFTQRVLSELDPSLDQGTSVSTSTPGCQTSGCTVIFPVSYICYGLLLAHWLTGSPSTSCLASITDQPSPTVPVNVPMVPPNIYAIYALPSVVDGCGKVLTISEGPGKTTSYGPSELSTLQKLPDGTTTPQVFNFQDLPCPPQGIQSLLNPQSVYGPILHPPPDLRQDFANSSFAECDLAAIKDPSIVATRAQSVSPPGGGGL